MPDEKGKSGSGRRDGARAFRTLLPVGLALGAAFVLGIAFWIVIDSVQASPPLPAGSADTKLEFLRERLEHYDRRARDTQWILGALLAAGALFTLLQGVFAYFSVQNFNTQAEAGIRRIDTSRQELETDFRRRMARLRRKIVRQLPLASNMESSLNEALRILDTHFQDANWYEGLYDNLSKEDRQSILFPERTLAGFAFLSVECLIPGGDLVRLAADQTYRERFAQSRRM